MIRRPLTILAYTLWWILLGLNTQPCSGQNYHFSVPEMELQVWIQPDASARMEYRIVFENLAGARPIDIVDIGLPHKNYDIRNMSATLDGKPLNQIRKSSYIDVGVEIELQQFAIQAGNRAEFRFQCTMPDMVYQDTTDKNLASFQVIPTWFDENSQTGRTQLQCAIHLLPETDAEQIKYQNESFKYTDLVLFGEANSKHPVAIWQYDSWRLSKQNPKLSVSFPKTGMQRVITLGPFGLFMKWFSESKGVQFASLGLLGILFGITFFRFSHGTGFVLFFLLAGFIGIASLLNPVIHLAGWPAIVGLFFWNERALKQRRTTGYLPAMATVEGGGIKRGLTAPQAAVLLELPVNKVLMLVIFGLLKKGLIERLSDKPLAVRVPESMHLPRKSRLQAAGERGVVIHDYEHEFLDRLMKHTGPVQDCDLSYALGIVVKSVAHRMAGFDLSQTQAYYRGIVQRALTEARSVGEIQQRDQVVDRNFEWILLDENWGELFDTWSRNGRPYRPWWERRNSGPVVIDGGSWNAPNTTTGTPETARTSLGEVASSFAGWTENTMASFASAIEPAKMGLDLPKSSGILDLSGVDRITGDVFKALAESAVSGNGGGRRGGGGGCACACAGCACACACAGGGR